MNDEEYYNFVRPYADAMQMLLTRLDVLNHNLYGKSDSRPIHYIQRFEPQQIADALNAVADHFGKEIFRPVATITTGAYKRG